MGVTEEGTSMSDESKKKAGLPGKKVAGLFCFGGEMHPELTRWEKGGMAVLNGVLVIILT